MLLCGTMHVVCCVQDVTWSLNVQKSGVDTMYQGAVTGQITVTNPQAVPVTVHAVNAYVQGGPSGTVSCGANYPIQVRHHFWLHNVKSTLAVHDPYQTVTPIM